MADATPCVTAPAQTPAALRWSLLACLPAVLVLGWQVAFAWPFFSDDSFITLRYAEHLLLGHGPVWNPGDRVEGYSNLLWLLLVAGLGALGCELVTAARLLGAFAVLASLWWLARLPRATNLRTAASAAMAPLLLASAAPLMGWTLGGLEGPLVLLWLVLGGTAVLRLGPDASRRALLLASLPFALLCWTRPDGPLWAATTGILLGGSLRRVVTFGLLPLLAVLLQLGFRLAFYGDFVPNTARVKVEGSAALLGTGLEYLGQGAWVCSGLLLPALSLPLLRRLLPANSTRMPLRDCHAPALRLLLPTALWLGWLATVGGDHFPGYRMWLPALALPSVLVAATLRQPGSALRSLGLLCGLAGAAANVWLSRTDPLSTHVRSEHFEWRAEVLGHSLRRAFAMPADQQPRLAVDAAGALPYCSGLPALDMLGLSDRTIATSKAPAWAAAAASGGGLVRQQGHLRGNGDYVMAQQPDLMLFGPPPGLPLPVFLSALQFEDDPRFLAGYRCIVLDLGMQRLRTGNTEHLRAPLWVQVHGRAGAQPTTDGLVIPAYLLGAYQQPRAFRFSYAPPAPGTPDFDDWKRELDRTFQWFTGGCFAFAVPDQDGALQLELRQPQAARLRLALAAGRYRLRAEPEVPALLSLAGCERDGEGCYRVTADGLVAIELLPLPTSPLPLRCQRIHLERLP